jgi:hypothetical protein
MNDPLHQCNRQGWRVDQIVQDMAGGAWNSGSGFILRRQALLSIGGFPTDCLTEDVYSSMLMLSKGWETAYVPESLQYGLVPGTFHAHVKQLVRWVRLSKPKSVTLHTLIRLAEYRREPNCTQFRVLLLEQP